MLLNDVLLHERGGVRLSPEEGAEVFPRRGTQGRVCRRDVLELRDSAFREGAHERVKHSL